MVKAPDSDWTYDKAQKELPTEPAEIGAEIEALEKRLELLRIAQRHPGPKAEFPRYVYKAAGKPESAKTPVPVESHLVESQEALDKLGDGWGDHPADTGDGKAATSKAGESDGGPLEGNVSDVANHAASLQDADALKALKAQERKGKGRQGVYDAIDARLAELKEHA